MYYVFLKKIFVVRSKYSIEWPFFNKSAYSKVALLQKQAKSILNFGDSCI